MDAIKAGLRCYVSDGIPLIAIVILLSIVIRLVERDKARRPDLYPFSVSEYETSAAILGTALFGLPFFQLVFNTLEAFCAISSGGFLTKLVTVVVLVLLYGGPTVYAWKVITTKICPEMLGVPCVHCKRFIHFTAWLCGYCDARNDNWFVRKCRFCQERPSAIVCPHCQKEVHVDRSQELLRRIARIAPPPQLPYEQQEAELQWRLDCLEREARIAEKRNLVKEKEAQVKRMNESFGLSQLQQMQLEIEAQVERELSANLEQKLVFSRMKEKVKTSYGSDSALLRDALTILESLEEKAKAESMRKPSQSKDFGK